MDISINPHVKSNIHPSFFFYQSIRDSGHTTSVVSMTAKCVYFVEFGLGKILPFSKSFVGVSVHIFWTPAFVLCFSKKNHYYFFVLYSSQNAWNSLFLRKKYIPTGPTNIILFIGFVFFIFLLFINSNLNLNETYRIVNHGFSQ